MPTTRKVLLYLFLFLSPLAFCKWTYDYTIFKLILPQIFFLFIAITFFLEKKNVRYHKTLTILLSLYLLINVLSFLINPFHYLSYPYMMKLLTYFSIFLLTVNLPSPLSPPLEGGEGRGGGYTKKIFFFLFASGALLSFWAVSDFYKFGLVNAGFGNKNFFAGYIIFLIPLVLSLAFAPPQQPPHLLSSPLGGEEGKERGKIYNKIILFLLFLLYSFALVLTKSQAAYLATFISILFLFILYSRNRKIALLKTFFILFFLFLISYFSNFYFVDQITGNVRFLVWKGTLKMIKVHPFLGWGPGTLSLHYPNYRLPDYFLQKAVAPITDHAHCEYLEILAESGVFGLFLFISFIFFIFREGFKYHPPHYPLPLREGKRGEGERAIIIGLLSGILAILMDNLLSTNLRQSFTPILLFFALGLVVSYSKGKMRDPSPKAQGDTRKFSSRFSALIFSLLILFLSLAGFNTVRKDVVAGFYLKKSLEARLKKNFPQSIAYYKKTISIDKFNPIAYYKLAFAYGVLKKYDQALSTYEKLYPLSPHYAQIDKNMAVLYYTEGRLSASLSYFRQAEKLNPYDVDVLCSIASIFIIKKEFPKAKFYLKRVLALDAKNSYALRNLKKTGN
ncbi:MAG: hypothetical protein CO162_07350 [bacterium (Candidatus Ratteibacteria) CG_4_9_14_3_um_filter_41_21]|uniref:O-antigen ligase-related domain-containing protein n=1 Tax=bacterium (Candidatus Ratteibacteria) CG_4_9_14_3_um_filter_41_21 TaxID=2014289 RepID=A0A2M7YE23_9BACT|nr:MAG: hypothetical protein AUJ76_02770 [Candidatus Omnitrophica bacterium CG1_02_41_171]PJA61235.1 MAG: hypothetical protein CO162_07350 [bacterium (Candidatus Ratteibacteria) CG_4_9_14_3_um_filter_41_21]